MKSKNGEKIKVLTWHIHGSYLYYLTQTPCDFYLPVKANKEEGYGGKSGTIPWGKNVHEIPAEEVKNHEFDCILFQSGKNYEKDQYEILSEKQRALPKIFLEHDPPREVPTDTRHIVDDPKMLLVHVTDFNNMMWNNNRTPTTVIQHGVIIHSAVYTGEIPKGIVVINGISKRGRRLGLDIFEKARKKIPLDLIGMGSEELGGLGEIPNKELPTFISKYRFFFNPIRYTSLGLSVCEAMMTGLPVVGMATTEMCVTIENDYSGYIHTNLDYLVEKMHTLIENPEKAFQLSKGARETAIKKFNIKRFTDEWLEIFRMKTGKENSLMREVGSEEENSIHK
ncbi:MAG: glycosyltransferase family 4 protein [Cytophagaceae bacterium]